jgi:protein tyrosine phosphatase (PTP) superfamily phosphohydrolase (DUF442 family)
MLRVTSLPVSPAPISRKLGGPGCCPIQRRGNAAPSESRAGGCRQWIRETLPLCVAALCLAAPGPNRSLAAELGAPTATTNQLRRIALPGVENSYQLTPRVYSGGQPAGDASFAALAKLGVKTVVSVDGALPDVAAARRHGLRYVHVPVGYDGISTNEALLLAQIAATLPGPIFVHCHHGKHRGPAAAALVCEAGEGWTAAQGEAWLRQAGTSAEYPGLYRAVRGASFPAPAQLAAHTNVLSESLAPQGSVATMVDLDQQWEELLLIQAAGYRPPPAHPDLSPSHSAARLQRSLREFATRETSRQRGADFLRLADESAAAATRLQAALQIHADSPDGTATNRLADAYGAVSRSCSACHKAYRNATP